jgi:hypothetical protein
MTSSQTRKLRTFFGFEESKQGCRLYLPMFTGRARLASEHTALTAGTHAASGQPFHYPGHTFADRDAKAASYVVSVLTHAVELDQIQWKESSAFSPGMSGTAVLFGSRSNQAADWATGPSGLGKFFRFEFDREWAIHCAGGQSFSLTAPNKLSREEYEQQTDFGVIGRFRNPEASGHVFLIAGLGSCATEGCGFYLASHWKELDHRFHGRDFAIVLRFLPPLDPRNSQSVAAFDENHPNGFSTGP